MFYIKYLTKDLGKLDIKLFVYKHECQKCDNQIQQLEDILIMLVDPYNTSFHIAFYIWWKSIYQWYK